MGTENRQSKTIEPKLGEVGTEKGITLRAVLIGIMLCSIIGIGETYGSVLIKGAEMGMGAWTPAAIFMFLLWVGIGNVILGLIHRKLALGQNELLTICIMMIFATGVQNRGLTLTILPAITGVYYFATVENEWAKILQPYVPHWMSPRDPDAIRYLYEGLPTGAKIPWKAWVEPLFWWFVFLFAFYLVVICIMVILRKQWSDNEKLIYPVAQVPLAIARESREGELIKSFFKSPVMWVGFSIPFLVMSWNALGNYYPSLPPIKLSAGSISLFRNTVGLGFSLRFPLLGLSYFISTDVAFSLWFFYLFRIVEQGIFGIVGYGKSETLAPFSGGGGTIGAVLSHQCMGAMIALVLFGIWTSREHLKAVFRKAIKNDKSVDDSKEVLSYRNASVGLLVGLTVMGVWLWKAGLALWIVPIFLFGALVVFIALTRLVVQGGLATVTPYLIPCDFVISGLGASTLGPRGMVAMSSTFVWASDLLTFLMAPCANALKIAEGIKCKKRSLLWAIILALAAGIASSLAVTMVLCYREGGLNLQGFFAGQGQSPYYYAARKLAENSGPNWLGWFYTSVGAGFTTLLILAGRYFVWWPFHPIGFVACTDWVMNNIWFTIFLTWLIKVIVLNYFGPRTYRKTLPFFLGLIAGQTFVAGFWLIVDYFTGMVGNYVHIGY